MEADENRREKPAFKLGRCNVKWLSKTSENL